VKVQAADSGNFMLPPRMPKRDDAGNVS